jgi:hypothetical protein
MLSKLTRSSHKIVQLVQPPIFSFKHTTNTYYLADVRLSLFNNIFGYNAMAISESRVKAGFRNYSGGRTRFGDLRSAFRLSCPMIYKLLLISIECLTRLNIRKIPSNTRVKIPTLRLRLRLEVG